MSNLRLYFRYIGISFRSQLAYKTSLIMLAFGNALGTGLEFFTIFAFFNRFGGLGQWTLYEVGLFYGMACAAYTFCESWMRGFDTFQNMIKQAEFDRVLVRPRSTVLQILGREFQILRLGRFAVSVGVLIWSMNALKLTWTAAEWALFFGSMLGGGLLFSGLILVQATSCFWTVETLEVFNMFTYGGLETAQYPLDIYAKWLKGFFMYVIPVAAVNFWPVSALLGKHYVPLALSYLSPLIGPAFFAVGILIWRFGVTHYRSTGS